MSYSIQAFLKTTCCLVPLRVLYAEFDTTPMPYRRYNVIMVIEFAILFKYSVLDGYRHDTNL